MIKKFLIHIINAIFVLVLLCTGTIIGGNLLGYKSYVVLSGSMEPNIHTGSLAFIDTNYNFDDVQINDIIAYNATDSVLITHRAINKENNTFETKGDNNDVSDGFTTNKDNFIGLTLFSIPYMGYVISFFNNTKGIIILATGLICLMIIEEIIKTSMKKETQENN